MNRTSFIAALFCTAGATTLITVLEGVDWVDFRLHAQAAEMSLADPRKKVTVPQGGPDFHLLDVRYRGPAGELLVPQKRLTGAVALRLGQGEHIPMTYLTNNPQHVLLDGAEPPALPWVWAVLTAALWPVFVLAWRLRRTESAHGEGMDDDSP